MRKEVNVERLIKEFEDMAERGTLLTGSNVSQEDLLIQIQGTIVKVATNERDFSDEPTLKNYVHRYKMNKKLLENNPEGKELIEKKIKENERDILNYLLSSDYE